MNDINFWKRTFLCGASLLLIAASPAMASGVDAMSTEGVAAVQQNGRTVTVTVNDAMGPVIGANVLVKGTTIGSITDMDGNAVIQGVPNGAVIIVSYIGYITQEINLPNGQSALTVELKEDAETLDEVVVVGYGTQAKKDITGSVAVVSRDAITEQPVATFAEALQGRASSVYINNAGGPAGDTTIRIRGVGSANGSDPLIIVDGVDLSPIEATYFVQDHKNYLWIRRKPIMEFDIERQQYITRKRKPDFECYLEKQVNGGVVEYKGVFTFLRFRYSMVGVWDRILGKDLQRLNLYVERLPLKEQTILKGINERKRNNGK